MSEVAPRAARGSRLGWAYLGVKLPTPLKRQLDAAATEAGRTLTDEVTARLARSFGQTEDGAP